jgi:hypothetical protein
VPRHLGRFGRLSSCSVNLQRRNVLATAATPEQLPDTAAPSVVIDAVKQAEMVKGCRTVLAELRGVRVVVKGGEGGVPLWHCARQCVTLKRKSSSRSLGVLSSGKRRSSLSRHSVCKFRRHHKHCCCLFLFTGLDFAANEVRLYLAGSTKLPKGFRSGVRPEGVGATGADGGMAGARAALDLLLAVSSFSKLCACEEAYWQCFV